MTQKTLASADSPRFAALKSVSSADRPNLIFTVFDREARVTEPHADGPFGEVKVRPTWRIRCLSEKLPVCRRLDFGLEQRRYSAAVRSKRGEGQGSSGYDKNGILGRRMPLSLVNFELLLRVSVVACELAPP
jgi:hypothetical protein